MQRILVLLSLLFSVGVLHAAGPLPGFRVEPLAEASGFITSLAVDSRGVIYYTTAQGDLYSLTGGVQRLIAGFPTAWEGNAGLLGVALLDDEHAVVRYTSPGRCAHYLTHVELATGKQTVILEMESLPPGVARGSDGCVSTEHHGGNLTVSADGAIWFGIGDFGAFVPAQDPAWIAGKIWRVTLDRATLRATATMWASGLRNSYDLAWDPAIQRIVLSDNGSQAQDEIHVLAEGDDAGWPNPVTPSGKVSVPPVYVFSDTVAPPKGTVAPTGLLRVNGLNPILRRGYIVAGFVTRSLYYFPSITNEPLADPIVILDWSEVKTGKASMIDVTDGPDGTIYFTTGYSVYRLDTPKRGDCNGDGLVNYADLEALEDELADGEGQPMIKVASGAYRGSWGCDANADGIVSGADADAIRALITTRHRSVRRR